MSEWYSDYQRIARNINKCGLKKLREYCTTNRAVQNFDRDLEIVKIALRFGISAPVSKYSISSQRVDQIMRKYEEYALDAMHWDGKPTGIEYNGKRMPLKKWAGNLGISYNTLYGRIYTKGWPIEKAFTTPVRRRDD